MQNIKKRGGSDLDRQSHGKPTRSARMPSFKRREYLASDGPLRNLASTVAVRLNDPGLAVTELMRTLVDLHNACRVESLRYPNVSSAIHLSDQQRTSVVPRVPRAGKVELNQHYN